ncbi:hypothetical protein B0T20DRAFT_401328 [Sordaria brevicollis]|uniref:Uncharacterized protein n=1 Tax=Sordaria brevicollis TaxID=83679 RepID=A0AAE0UI03_SORBR|nr:hypothetical protein B0T20DRAFT_401328 [Sordaria brevicollis]
MSENGEANNTTSPTVTNSADDARQELSVQLEDLLNTLSNKFAGVSSEIFAKSKCLDDVLS